MRRYTHFTNVCVTFILKAKIGLLVQTYLSSTHPQRNPAATGNKAPLIQNDILKHNIQSICKSGWGLTYKREKNRSFPLCAFLHQHSTS